MTITRMRQRAGHLVTTIARSGVRRPLIRLRLRRRHGLVSLGSDLDYHITENSVIGEGCRLGGPVFIAGSTIGDHTYVEVGCRISATDVGRFCSIAPNAMIGLAEHPLDGFVSTHPLLYRHIPSLGYDLVERDHHREMARTRIGNDVWIGANACVRGGLTIGDGAVIGAGAVVTRDVAPYTVCAGVPARQLRTRFSPDVIEFLLEFRWWERDLEWLRQHVAEMHDVTALMARFASDRAAGAVPAHREGR